MGFLVESSKTLRLSKRTSSNAIALKIVPLVPGPMRVTGFRYTLRGRTCVNVFDIPGRLLNDKRENKARRARAEKNEILAWDVVGNKPKIVVDAVAPLRMRANDVVPTKLRFRNVGEVAAQEVLVWTSQ